MSPALNPAGLPLWSIQPHLLASTSRKAAAVLVECPTLADLAPPLAPSILVAPFRAVLTFLHSVFRLEGPPWAVCAAAGLGSGGIGTREADCALGGSCGTTAK